ncbi:MAG: hypothetical protein ACR2KK_14385 [Acidimicrobiales bacterium]
MNRTRSIGALTLAAALALSVLGVTPAQAATTPGATYFPLSPTRLLDTRIGTGAPAGALGPGGTIELIVTGKAGVPGTGATAVVLNVTATDATAPDSFLTVYPANGTRPVASNLNVKAGRTATNLVTVAVPTTGDKAGKVAIYNNLGSVSVVADINGWYAANGTSVGGTYNPQIPDRVLDTRNGVGAVDSEVFPGQTIDVQVTGKAGVPTSGVSAVALNVTAIHESGPESFLTVFPSGTERPVASNLNFLNRQSVPNMVIARVGTNGKVSIYNNLGLVNIVADVQGWYTSTGVTTGATYVPVPPARDLDTRTGLGTGGTIGRMGPGQTLDLTVTGINGVPTTGVMAVVLNVTAVDHTGPDSFLTVFPSSAPPATSDDSVVIYSPILVDGRPLASNLNFVAGQTSPNLVIARVGPNGKVSIYNNAGSVHVLADVQGWFLANGA